MADSNGVMQELQPRATTRTIPFLGKFRLVGDLEIKEMMFLLFAFVSMLGAGIISVVRIQMTSDADPEMTFSILLLVNLVFILYYVVHGVFCERPLELLVSVIATLIVMLYCIVEYAVHGYQSVGENKNLKLGRLIAVCALGPVDIVMGCTIAFQYYVSGNLIFRTVGGNSVLQVMCKRMFMFTALLKFDFQLVINLLILILVGNVHRVTLGESLVIGLGAFFSIIWLILGYLMLRYELMRLSSVFWLFSLAEPGYIVYLFIRTGKELKKNDLDLKSAHTMLLYCVILAGVVALLIRIALVVVSIIVTRNFGKGLKEKVYVDEPASDSYGSTQQNANE
uniref:DUF7789 domain-containing protein n=2 Tax=Clytia hemisphaerica TaxID=252671 RepID=A0A7M5VDC2_9CNID